MLIFDKKYFFGGLHKLGGEKLFLLSKIDLKNMNGHAGNGVSILNYYFV